MKDAETEFLDPHFEYWMITGGSPILGNLHMISYYDHIMIIDPSASVASESALGGAFSSRASLGNLGVASFLSAKNVDFFMKLNNGN